MFRKNKEILISGIFVILLSVGFTAAINYMGTYDFSKSNPALYFVRTVITLSVSLGAFAAAYKYGKKAVLKYGWILIPSGIIASGFVDAKGCIEIFNYSFEIITLANTLSFVGFAVYFYRFCIKSVIHNIVFWVLNILFVVVTGQYYLTLIMFIMSVMMLISAHKNKLIEKKTIRILNIFFCTVLFLRALNITLMGIYGLKGLFYDNGYMAFIARITIMKAKLFGSVAQTWLIGGDVHGYKLLWIVSLFGIIPGAVVFISLTCFVFFVCRKSLKTALGGMKPVSCAAASILFVRYIVSVLANFGIVLHGIYAPIPFLSDTIFGYVAIFILTGLLLSEDREDMRLSQSKEIYILPIKKLCSGLSENPPDRKTVAVILSMENTDYPELNMLDACHKVEVLDTEMKENPFSFCRDDAFKVKEFIERESDFERIYICCDSGESRSTAMAAAIMKYYGDSDKKIWTDPQYHPNGLVYREQLRVFGIRAGKLRLKYLKYINDKALKRAMKKV